MVAWVTALTDSQQHTLGGSSAVLCKRRTVLPSKSLPVRLLLGRLQDIHE